MKKKSSAICFSALLAGLFLFSCAQQDAAPGQEKSTANRQVSDSHDYCDTSRYEIIYDNDGYVLLRSKDSANKFAGKPSFLAGGEIHIDTARAWVKHYYDNFSAGTLQRTRFIDFDYKTVFGILDLLQNSQGSWDPDKGGLRVYLGAYPATHSTASHRNYINTILVGTYDNVDADKYYNLGHLCPPNCYGGGTSTFDNTRSPILQ